MTCNLSRTRLICILAVILWSTFRQAAAQEITVTPRITATAAPVQESSLDQREIQFTARYTDNSSGGGTPDYFLQSGAYRSGGYTLSAEMGNLDLSAIGIGNTAGYRGALIGFSTGNSTTFAGLKTFLLTGTGTVENLLTGAFADLSIARRVRVSTLFAARSEERPQSVPRGGILKVSTALLPPGELLDLQLQAGLFDPDDTGRHSGDSASSYYIGLNGKRETLGYEASYERTDAQYRPPWGSTVSPDREGFTASVRSSAPEHDVVLKLSQHHNNIARTAASTSTRRNGSLSYSYRGIKSLPVGVDFSRTLISRTGSLSPQEIQEDALAGRLNYLSCPQLDLGVRAEYSQSGDTARKDLHRKVTTVSVTPRFNSGDRTVVPDLSVRHSSWAKERQERGEYLLNLDVRETSGIRYNVHGRYGWERSAVTPSGRETRGASLRIGYPLGKLLRNTRHPSLGIQGQYLGDSGITPGNRNDSFSLMMVLEGKS